MKRVYLAGPITGLTYDEGNDWRLEAKEYFDRYDIAAYSPMRAKEYLRSEGKLTGSYKSGLFSSARNIMTRDYDDCTKADVILCNFLGATRVSIGTVMECAWAYGNRIPLVVISEAENIHNHPMMDESIGFRVETLAEGLYVARTILLP